MSESSVRFISDLHLSNEIPHLSELFFNYLKRIEGKTERLFILGDLFEVWLGDDALGQFERSVALAIRALSESGTKVFFLPGNRDFLLGESYCKLAGMHLLADPFMISLGGEKVLLTHGDDLCTLDKSHQRFRRLTRLSWVKALFLSLPRRFREAIALKIRKNSKAQGKSREITDVVEGECVKKLKEYNCTTLIHGHTHRPQVGTLNCKEGVKRRIVLSDWRQTETELCYNQTHEFKLIL